LSLGAQGRYLSAWRPSAGKNASKMNLAGISDDRGAADCAMIAVEIQVRAIQTNRGSLAAALFALASLAFTAAQAAPVLCVAIAAQKQGVLPGSGRPSLCEQKIEALSFSFSSISPRDPATGMATARRQNKPVRIRKEWSVASPQIFAAFVGNEPLPTVTIDFFVPDPNGKMLLDHTIRLTNAIVTSVEHSSETRSPTGQPSMELAIETVEFVYQQIELIDYKNKVSAIG
jgi:type VI secretion system secreted protein Hcp